MESKYRNEDVVAYVRGATIKNMDEREGFLVLIELADGRIITVPTDRIADVKIFDSLAQVEAKLKEAIQQSEADIARVKATVRSALESIILKSASDGGTVN